MLIEVGVGSVCGVWVFAIASLPKLAVGVVSLNSILFDSGFWNFNVKLMALSVQYFYEASYSFSVLAWVSHLGWFDLFQEDFKEIFIIVQSYCLGSCWLEALPLCRSDWLGSFLICSV